MNNEDIAKQLAAITGKPVAEFLNGKCSNNDGRNLKKDRYENAGINPPKGRTDGCTVSTECDKDEPAENTSEGTGTETQIQTRAEKVEEYKELFNATDVTNGYIMNGRKMTRKEYLKCAKKLTEDELLKHSLLYKMFRSEGQLEPNFLHWCNRFPKKDT